MKTIPSLLIAACAAAALTWQLRAQEKPAGSSPDPFIKDPAAAAAQPGGAPWRNCLVVLEVYTLDKQEAFALLAAENGSSGRYRRITELAKANKARLDTLTAITTKSGQTIRAEGRDELRFPMGFARPVGTNSMAEPAAYETYSVGDSLEVEVVVNADNRNCAVNLAPRWSTLAGFHELGVMVGGVPVAIPSFDSQWLTTSLTLTVDEPRFIGTFSASRGLGDAGREMRLAFLRVNLTGPATDELKPPASSPDWSALELQYSFYSLDRAAAREILSPGANADAAWNKLQPLLNAKTAQLDHLLLISGKSGSRVAVEETGNQVMAGYLPTEIATGEEKTTRTVESPLVVPGQSAGEPSKARATTKEVSTTTRPLPSGAISPGMPGDIELRVVGTQVAVEPVVGPDGISVDINHELTATAPVGDLKATGLAAKYPAQPVFEVRRITTSHTVLAGRQMLVGTFNPPGANGVNDRTDTGRTWLVFVRAMPNQP